MTCKRLVTPFGATSTAADVLQGVDLHGRRAIVTGGASGIGLETARALGAAGADVVIAVRDVDAGQRAVDGIVAALPRIIIRAARLDLADLASVNAFAESWRGALHILVNNAGIMATPEWRTPSGWELQFATNHVGHFALALGLRRALADAAGARIVSVSSGGHLLSPVVFDDIHFRTRPYQPWLAYGQSKSANALFAVGATRHWHDDGIVANALMPGAIRSNLQRHLDSTEQAHLEARMSGSRDFAWKTPAQGAATSVLLAASPLLEGVGGRYFEDCNEALPNVPGSRRGVAPHALDEESASRLWQLSTDMVRR
jgi:NAD(P)-dependent dehydrogenase (short-subunit alcohol dehydrogenase family)